MKDWWLKLGCFLTGYNYRIVKNSSEAAAKTVKKYMSAMLIITTLWAFIGFAFTKRYLHGDFNTSLAGAIIMMLMIVQIERQIILSVGRNNWAIMFRISIGIIMAIIGSVILDQVIFKDDIDKNKIENVQNRVNEILPIKTKTLANQIKQLDSIIETKEVEKISVMEDVGRNPMISSYSSSNISKKDSLTNKMKVVTTTLNKTQIPNPKISLIPQLQEQIDKLREQKNKKENDILNAQQLLEIELNEKVGFLDELTILFDVLFSSPIAFFVWFLLFLFFMAIELFIIVNKMGDKMNDYEKTIIHQMDIRMKMIDELTNK